MNLPLVSTLQGIVPVSSLGSCWSLWRRKRPRLKSELNFLELNNSKAYKCHYLSPICDPDSRTRFSLSFQRTGQLSNRRARVFLFSSSGFSNDVESPQCHGNRSCEKPNLEMWDGKDFMEMAASEGQEPSSWRQTGGWSFAPLCLPHLGS